MAFLELHYHSDALKMGVSVNVILPERAKTLIGMRADSGAESYKTLFLLHGLSDDHTIWMRRTSIERYAAERGIAVVMPSVARSWYTDTADGAAYLTFITEELPNVCRSYFRGMSDRREDTMIAGLSMGGYGAVKAALVRPDRFGACASLSGALDISDLKGGDDVIPEWRGIFGFELDTNKQLRGTRHDVFALAEENKQKGLPFPTLYLWCGTEDFLLEQNRSFHAHLERLGVSHCYEEASGNHAWLWWDRHVQRAMDVMLGGK